MIIDLYYPTFLIFAILLTFILIPRDKYKHYFIYGLIVGALGDLILTGFLSHLGVAWFPNAGIFQVARLNILSPLSWVPVTMLFLRFLPQRNAFLYLYVVGFSVLGVSHGYVVQNAGLYDFQPWYYPGVAFLVVLGFFSFITFVYRSSTPLEIHKL